MVVPAGQVAETTLQLVVLRRHDAADGVVTLELGHPDGQALPEWEAGAHIDVVLGAELIRQYSICGMAEDPTRWRIGVLREPAGRGGSAYLHDHLQEGVAVSVIGPRNHFALVPSSQYIFVAGGIGITPILPMIRAAEAAGAAWTLSYGGRTRSSMAFLDELAAYGPRVSVQPFDEVGLIDLASLLDIPRADALIYACGPEPLLAAVEARCAAWPHNALHVERFAAKPLEEPAFAGVFEIEAARNGDVYTVAPHQSIMEVLEDAGYDILCSCREGVCGSCETGLLGGAADHRDVVLSDDDKAADTRIMICVSRSKRGDRLVLDI